MSLLVGMVAAEDFKLAAVALLKNENADVKCIKTDGDIQYWVNMATGAEQATRIIATSEIQMPELTVNGPVTLGSGSDDINVEGNLVVTKTGTFDDVTLKLYVLKTDGTRENEIRQSRGLSSHIEKLERKIAQLCLASPGTCN